MWPQRIAHGLLTALLSASSGATFLAGGPSTANATTSPLAGPQDAGDTIETRAFSTPETLIVRAVHDRARGHVEARRWSEAISDLQTILEKHTGELLPEERPKTRDGRTSADGVFPGAGLRARRMLLGLPTEARTAYRDRYEVDAARALAAARAAQDAWALAEVGRRWPLCDSAVRAYVSLFDLELERGHETEARGALSRALSTKLFDPDLRAETAEDFEAARARIATPGTGGDDAAGLVRRIDFTIQRLRAVDTSILRARNERELRLPSLDEAPGPVPGEGGDAWTSAYTLPRNPYTRAKDPRADPFFAVRSGERIFVSTSLRVLALHAYTGELLWDSNEPRGWSDLREGQREELFKGLDEKTGLVAPAASANVVVAALQLPFTLLQSDKFNTINITTPIPERRLFAFDAQTGRKLWDHTPPKGWDGDGGTFAQRSTIAGPPVIAGSRVLAPCVRMQGRINYNVGCFDLDTGELLWSRDVISGQREQNMFGRAEHEFQSAPLRVEGDRVIAITQLGTIACLDLFTGEILWETLHEVIETPRNRNFQAPVYPAVWRNTPPVVVDGVVLATPVNSHDLVALDLSTGAMLWSQSFDSIARLTGRIGGIDMLLGASKTAIYVGGDRLMAIDMPSGVAQRSPLRAKWVYNDDVAPQPRVGRPVLAADCIVLPRLDQRVEVDLETGLERAAVEWPDSRGGGNILLGSGEMFVTSTREVRGFFEWDVLVDRARADLARTPNDTTRALRLARLLDGRGSAEWSRGKSESARAHYAEAKAVLERASSGPADDSRLELAAVSHSILRGEARVRAALADVSGALADLRAARAVAPDKASLRDTLAEELSIRIERENTPGDDPAATRAARDELERECGDLALLTEVRADDGSAPLPFGASYLPVTGGKPADDVVVVEMPVGLWVVMERARVHARTADTRGEFADLHAVLERYADVELVTGRAGDLAEARLAALVSSGRTEGFEDYEARAQAILDAGVAAHDDAALRRVARLYPLTRAARAANDARLSLALMSDDVATVAKIVGSELPDDWNLATCTEREARLLRRLATALGHTGNRQAEGAILRALAASRPDTTSDLPEDGGLTLAQLAQAAPVFPAPTNAPAAGAFDVGTFRVDPDVASERPFAGDYEILGETVEDVPLQEITAGHETAMVCAWNRPPGMGVVATLVALSSADPVNARWMIDLPTKVVPPATQNGVWARRTAFAAGRVIVGMNEAVIGYDTQKGSQAWMWVPGVPVDSVSVASRSGVVIVVATPRVNREPWIVTALDAHSGAELWRDMPTDAEVQRLPILSDDRVVFVPLSGRKRVVVRDLFTGSRSARFDLETSVTNSVSEDAWIEGSLLVVPWFTELRSTDRNQVLAVDLNTGQRAWRVALDETGAQKRWLSGVVQQGGRTWLVVQSSAENTTAQSLSLLDTRIGALTPVSSVRLGEEDRILGLSRAGRIVTPTGPIAVVSPRTGSGAGRGSPREARLRCIDLDRGELWIQGLNLGFDEIAPGASGMPALSERAIAITVGTTEARGRVGTSTSSVWFFDRHTGQSGGRREVRKADGRDVPQLVPLGDTLLLRTKNQLEVLR